MALIKLSILAAISGSIGGTVYTRNAYGAVARSFAMPTNPNSTGQQRARGDFASASAAWKALDADQRQAWATFAQSYAWTNALGESGKLSANALYAAFRSLLNLAGFAAPSPDVPQGGSALAPVLSFSGALSVGTNSIAIDLPTVGNEFWRTNPNAKLLVFLSDFASATRPSDVKRTMRYAGAVAGSAGTPPTTITVTARRQSPASAIFRVRGIVVTSSYQPSASGWADGVVDSV